MYIEELFNTAMLFFQRHIYIGMASVFFLALYTLKKPVAAAKFFAFCLAMLLVLYVVSLAGKSMFAGVEKTDKMIHQTVKK